MPRQNEQPADDLPTAARVCDLPLPLGHNHVPLDAARPQCDDRAAAMAGTKGPELLYHPPPPESIVDGRTRRR